MNNSKNLEDIAREIRLGAFEVLKDSANGHLGASSSSVELLTSLYFDSVLKYDFLNPKHPNRDRVLIRGHVGPTRYKIFSLLDWIDQKELSSYRQIESRLKGHEDMLEIPGVDITPSGSLGMLLSYGVGCGLSAKITGQDFKTIVLLGDGEEQEGNVSEAARHAASLKLNNIICIIDQNGKQLSRPTSDSDRSSDISKIWQGYGWQVRNLSDGHNLEEISNTLKKIKENQQGPVLVISPTIKGKDVPGCINSLNGYHTLNSCSAKDLDQAIISLETGMNRKEIRKNAQDIARKNIIPNIFSESRQLKSAIDVSARLDSNESDLGIGRYFNILEKKLKDEKTKFYFLTSDWIRKEFTESYQNINYIDFGIREQHMVATAHGISVTDPDARVIVNIGDFLSYRCADQINACVQGKSNVLFLADGSGLTQGQNGKTHQSSGQPGMIFSMSDIGFFEPADEHDLYNILNHCLNKNNGPNYVRLFRKSSKNLSRVNCKIDKMDHYICFDSPNPVLNLVGSGLVSSELCNVSEVLERDYKIPCRVINVVDHRKIDSSFANYFDKGSNVFVAYNGNCDFFEGNIAKNLIRNGRNPSKIYSHGFETGDTGSTIKLMEKYKLDAKGLVEIILNNFDLPIKK